MEYNNTTETYRFEYNAAEMNCIEYFNPAFELKYTNECGIIQGMVNPHHETLKYKLLTETAQAPFKNPERPLNAGLDICSDEELEVPPKERRVISTGLAVEIPHGHYGRIAPRSGLAAKHGIDVMAGVVDIGYTGEVAVILYNTSTEAFCVTKGMKIAQLILERVSLDVELQQVEELTDSNRGSAGFGSSGY